MIIPVRCWSCGKVIAHAYAGYKKAVELGEDPQKAVDEAGLERYCCRRMFLSHVELIDEVSPFSVAREELI